MDGFAEFGWRGRIGYIVAIPVIEHMPYEFYQMAPKGVGIVITSLGKKDQGAEETEKALGRLDQAIADLAAVGADYICVASSPMVAYRGPGADREIISQIRKIAKVPGSTTTTVAMDALKFFGAQRIVLVSPYASQNEKVKVFLEAEGFKVLHAKGVEAKLTAIGRLPGSLAYRLAKEAVQEAPERPQAVYIAGGLLRATGQVALLEQDLGIPVVASHAAFIWAACRALSIHETIKGYGKLLETLSEAKP